MRNLVAWPSVVVTLGALHLDVVGRGHDRLDSRLRSEGRVEAGARTEPDEPTSLSGGGHKSAEVWGSRRMEAHQAVFRPYRGELAAPLLVMRTPASSLWGGANFEATAGD